MLVFQYFLLSLQVVLISLKVSYICCFTCFSAELLQVQRNHRKGDLIRMLQGLFAATTVGSFAASALISASCAATCVFASSAISRSEIVVFCRSIFTPGCMLHRCPAWQSWSCCSKTARAATDDNKTFSLFYLLFFFKNYSLLRNYD